MFRIRRFGVIRTATVVAVAYAIAFAILAVPLVLIALSAPRGAFGLAAAIPAMLIALLVIYPLLIWVLTAVACLVYNLAARWVGGIEVDVERVAHTHAASGYPGQPYGQATWQYPTGQQYPPAQQYPPPFTPPAPPADRP
ncbi:MAG TPA: hypothetical protein VMP67_09540 [Candidatus Limnocylindria bacterium]|nr:hypothetical protein [Candidatus Limnocylindria bacterium]